MSEQSTIENLDYFDETKFSNYENQTNYTISVIMNDFITKYRHNFKNKYFIIELQDNIYSIIAYRILKNLQGVFSFKLKFIGNYKHFADYVNKKDKLSLWDKIIKKKSNRIFISCYNPIYKVEKTKLVSKKNLNIDFYVIDKFTKEQFKIISKFFNIEDRRNELL